MRFTLSNEPTLNYLYKLSLSWKRFSCTKKASMLKTIYGFEAQNGFRTRKAMEYCTENNLPLDSASQELEKFDIAAYDAILKPFNVQLISNNVEEKVSLSFMQWLDYLKGKSLVSLLGECNGILVFKESVCIYSVSNKGSFLECYSRYSGDSSTYYYQFGSNQNTETASWQKEKSCPNGILPIAYLIFKKFVDIETQIVAPNAKRVSIENKGDSIVNKAPFPI